MEIETGLGMTPDTSGVCLFHIRKEPEDVKFLITKQT